MTADSSDKSKAKTDDKKPLAKKPVEKTPGKSTATKTPAKSSSRTTPKQQKSGWSNTNRFIMDVILTALLRATVPSYTWLDPFFSSLIGLEEILLVFF